MERPESDLGSKEDPAAASDRWIPCQPEDGEQVHGRDGHLAIYPKANLSKRSSKEAIVPYLLRNFEAQLPNQAWSIDIAYVKLNHRHMYLTGIIDWYSRKIVGRKLSVTLSTKAVLDVVLEAVETHDFRHHQFRPGKSVHQRRIH